MSEDPRTGKVLQGRYKILAPLAEGGMGVVYRGERVGIGRPVVVKFLHAVLSEQPGIVDRFEREARATARLNHPNCVALVDYGIEDGSPYLVMEYAEGKTLADLLDFGPLAARRSVHIAKQVLAGLSHAHDRGILHRDLKPANIMVIEAVGHTDFVKILDFGLAKVLGQVDGKKDVTVAGIAIGTPGYMSPEQAAGVPSDRRADIYCTGALLYHLVTGSKAFEGDDIHSVLRKHREETPALPRKLMPSQKLSSELEKVIMRSMERDPAERYQTAEEMIDALDDTPEAKPSADEAKPRKERPSSSGDDVTRAEQPSARARERRPQRLLGVTLVGGVVIGAGATVALALYTPLVRDLLPGARSPAVAARAVEPARPHEPVRKNEPVRKSEPTHALAPPSPLPVVELKPSPSPLPQAPSPSPLPSPSLAAAVPPKPTAAVDDEDDDTPPAKVDDGSNEDDRAPPPEAPAVPKRDVPQVRSLSDVKALLKKGDQDTALAGLFRLRRQKPAPSPRVSSEIAIFIGNIYFDRKWWTDALKEYRFAIRLDARAKRDEILVGNTVRTLGDPGTYWRARRLLLEYIGKSSVPALRSAARSGSGDVKRQAQRVLDTLEGHSRHAKR